MYHHLCTGGVAWGVALQLRVAGLGSAPQSLTPRPARGWRWMAGVRSGPTPVSQEGEAPQVGATVRR